MTPGLEIWRCAGCGARFFPERLLCPRCHSGTWARETVLTGTVEEVATIRHMLGQENWQPRRIASVRTASGVLITAGLLDDVGEGAAIDLFEEDGAPFGRASRA